MATWSADSGGYKFGPYGPTLQELCPDIRFRRALDLGCGDGTNTRFLLPIADEVWGVDSDAAAVGMARAASPSGRFAAGIAEDYLRSSSLTFDGVVCSRLLGFIPDLHALFAPLHARTDGYFLLSDWHPLACWITPTGLVGMDYSSEGSFAPGQYHHTISSITNALVDSGFTVRRIVEGPARRFDPDYRGAPLAVQGLPLTMTWICTSAGRPDEKR